MDIDSLRPVEDENDEDGNSEEDNENVENVEREVNQQPERRRGHRNDNKQFLLSYRDVEDSVRSYNGTDSYPIERWINDFEEAAAMFRWNDIQKVVFAKKSLKGIGKLFIQNEDVIKTWKKLKDALTKKFSRKISISAQLYRMLKRRRIKKEETIQEYFLAMRELASRSTIKTDALFDYVINGMTMKKATK